MHDHGNELEGDDGTIATYRSYWAGDLQLPLLDNHDDEI